MLLEIHAVQRAGHAGQHRRGDEGHHLVLGHVDAHGLCRDAVVTGGHNGPARAAVDQVHNHDQ